jgi:hypothetical protein
LLFQAALHLARSAELRSSGAPGQSVWSGEPGGAAISGVLCSLQQQHHQVGDSLMVLSTILCSWWVWMDKSSFYWNGIFPTAPSRAGTQQRRPRWLPRSLYISTVRRIGRTHTPLHPPPPDLQAFRPRVGGQSLTLSTRPARRIAALPCRTKIYGCKPLTFFSAVSWLHSTQMYPAQGLMIDSELRFTNCHATRNATSKAPFIVWLSDCSMVGIFYLLVIIFGPLFFRLRWKSLGRICFFLGKKYCHKKVYCFSCLLNCDLNYFGYTPQHLPMSHDSSYILILMNWDGHKITMGVSILLPPFQIIRHSKNLGESKHLKFDQNYRENYKNL